MEEIDVELTPKILESMAGYAAIDFSTVFKYVPAHFRLKDNKEQYLIPKKFWPTFEMVMMTGIEKSNLEDQMTVSIVRRADGAMESVATPGHWRLMMIKNHIRSWSNLRNKKGKLIKFDKLVHLNEEGTLSVAALNLLDEKLQEDLASAIANHFTLSEEELRGLE